MHAQKRFSSYANDREFGLKITVTLVPSQKNKADMLTRVKKAWQQEKKDLHNMHYFGKVGTLYLVRKVNPNITTAAVKKVVEQCRECQSTDPAPSRHEKGELHVAKNWKQLAIYITHSCHEPYLSMIDCRPGIVAI